MDEITIDSEEMRLLCLYEKKFGEAPPSAHPGPETSKSLIKKALKAN